MTPTTHTSVSGEVHRLGADVPAETGRPEQRRGAQLSRKLVPGLQRSPVVGDPEQHEADHSHHERGHPLDVGGHPRTGTEGEHHRSAAEQGSGAKVRLPSLRGGPRKPVLSEARIAAGTSAAAAANEITALSASRSSGSKPHSEAGLVEEHVISIYTGISRSSGPARESNTQASTLSDGEGSAGIPPPAFS